jgi:uncharacterized protein with HEPN domain
MSRDDAYLLDILEAARLATSYVAGKTESEFLSDSECQDAVIRRLEVIAEAARRVSQETQDSLSQVPWSAMIGMRNIMIHRYDDVDVRIVWDSVQDALPSLIVALEKVLPPQGAGD